MRKLPLLLVEWDDTTSGGGWLQTSTVKHANTVCQSVGWKILSDKEAITLTSMKADDGNCSDRQTIPRGCIRKIRRLE